jgi:hypothetical protein
MNNTKYNDLSTKYIKKYYWSRPSTFKLDQLLSVDNRTELCNLEKFIHLACKARNNLLNCGQIRQYQTHISVFLRQYRITVH